MPLTSCEYKSISHNGKIEECNDKKQTIYTYMKDLYLRSKITGSRIRTIENIDDLIDLGLCDEDISELLDRANKNYPFIYILVSQKKELIDQKIFENIQLEFDLIKTRQFS